MAQETHAPSHNRALKQLEKSVRQFIVKRAEERNKKSTKQYLDDLTEVLFNLHQEILAGLYIIPSNVKTS